MESKYYMPELSEFFDGFEYEHLESKIWRDSKFIFRDLNVISKQINNGEIRVKLLDREDIESLGFISLHKTSFRFKKVFHLEINETYLHISDTSYNGTRVVFDGVIKNKSELQKLMIQLEIK